MDYIIMGIIKHSRSTIDGNATVLTCPAGSLIEILQIHVVYTSSATAGNRRLLVTVQDDSDTEVCDYHAGAQQGASLARHYTYARGITRENNFVDTSLHVAIPFGTILLAGWDLVLEDSNAVDESGDSAVVNIIYEETNHNDGDTVT
jgi:hypothetical protein